MCHSLPLNASFWFALVQLDQHIADQVRNLGCSHCRGKLHVANYPRKPRGIHRDVLGPEYTQRLSFCCSVCHRRTTPPSVRFLGRKVYLASIITLLSAGTDASSLASLVDPACACQTHLAILEWLVLTTDSAPWAAR